MNQVVTPWRAQELVQPNGVFEPSYEVRIEKGIWVDAARGDRAVPYKIYLPQTTDSQQKFPVVVWSHGLGGSRDGAGFISRALAAHGYVVAHVQHRGTDSSLWEGKPGHPWDVIRATFIPRKATLQRLQDMPFIVEQIDAFAKTDAGKHMDVTRLGMSGHSFGAMTTQLVAGQTRGVGRHSYRLRDIYPQLKRFEAGIVYSPVPVRHKAGETPAHYYGSIEIPLLIMTGTADASPIENFGYEYRLEVPDNAGGPEQSLLVLNDGDHMVYNGSRGKLEDNPKREMHENIIVTGTLAFWDAYLKQDKNAHDWLTAGGFASYLQAEGTYRFRP